MEPGEPPSLLWPCTQETLSTLTGLHTPSGGGWLAQLSGAAFLGAGRFLSRGPASHA